MTSSKAAGHVDRPAGGPGAAARPAETDMVTVQRSGLTTFRFTCSSAGRLYLVGDFNGWDPAGRPMQRQGEATWVARLWLAPGTYQFKYRSDDGRWFNDHAAFGLSRGPLGWNSTVVVSSDQQRDLSLLPPYRRPAATAARPLAARAQSSAASRIPPTPAEGMTLDQLRAILPVGL